ncbi:Transcriptional regulator of ribosomal biogenesis proteins [Tilletia horrida]|nr:Transcriptional regulator of ribosomal biogenesis proteins [Tilletia horrida]
MDENEKENENEKGKQLSITCPRAGCSKAYAHKNGLKYHLSKGTCTNLPHRYNPRISIALPSPSPSPSSPSPSPSSASPPPAAAAHPYYQCQVGHCPKRYLQPNGLRYHYQHSAAHGMLGLHIMLAHGGSSSALIDPATGRACISTLTLTRHQVIAAAHAAADSHARSMLASSPSPVGQCDGDGENDDEDDDHDGHDGHSSQADPPSPARSGSCEGGIIIAPVAPSSISTARR